MSTFLASSEKDLSRCIRESPEANGVCVPREREADSADSDVAINTDQVFLLSPCHYLPLHLHCI